MDHQENTFFSRWKMDGNNSLIENMKMEKKPEEGRKAVGKGLLEILTLRVLDYKISALKRIREHSIDETWGIPQYSNLLMPLTVNRDYLNIGDLFLTKQEKEEKQYIQGRTGNKKQPWNFFLDQPYFVQMDNSNSLIQDTKMEKKPEEGCEDVGIRRFDESMISRLKIVSEECAVQAAQAKKQRTLEILEKESKIIFKKQSEDLPKGICQLHFKSAENIISGEKTFMEEIAAKSYHMKKMEGNTSLIQFMKSEWKPVEGREAVGKEIRQFILDSNSNERMISAEKTVTKEFALKSVDVIKMDGINSLIQDMKMEKKPKEGRNDVEKEIWQNLESNPDECMISVEEPTMEEFSTKSDHMIQVEKELHFRSMFRPQYSFWEVKCNPVVQKENAKNDKMESIMSEKEPETFEWKSNTEEKHLTKQKEILAEHEKMFKKKMRKNKEKMIKENQWLTLTGCSRGNITALLGKILWSHEFDTSEQPLQKVSLDKTPNAKNDKMESIMSEKEPETFEWKSNTEEKHLTKQKEILAEHEKMFKKKMRKNKEKMIKENQWLTIGELGHMSAVHQIVVDRLKIATWHIWNLRIYVPFLMI